MDSPAGPPHQPGGVGQHRRGGRIALIPATSARHLLGWVVRIDLHAHSNVSDGTETPAEVMAAAAAAGLDVVALTDHDSTDGWAEASGRPVTCGVALVPGMEISCRTREGISVHLLSYLHDPAHPGPAGGNHEGQGRAAHPRRTDGHAAGGGLPADLGRRDPPRGAGGHAGPAAHRRRAGGGRRGGGPVRGLHLAS